jgi:hypothetical protein
VRDERSPVVRVAVAAFRAGMIGFATMFSEAMAADGARSFTTGRG